MTDILNMQEDNILNMEEQSSAEIKPKNFNDIEISTKTIIGVSNLSLNIEELFNNLIVSTYIQIPKKRGRKKKELPPDPNADLKEGSIINEKSSYKFIITDLKNEIIVSYSGLLPNLFSEGKGVVAEGTLNDKKYFVAETILAKHDENYMPPEVSKAIENSKN